MVSSDGTEILRQYTHPSLTSRSNSQLQWPHQPFPSESNWKTWRLTLLKCLSLRISYDNKWRLSQPLGTWLSNTSHIKYQYYMHLTSGHLWDVVNNRCFQKRLYQKVYSKIYSHGEPPSQQMSPALVHEHPTVYRVN